MFQLTNVNPMTMLDLRTVIFYDLQKEFQIVMYFLVTWNFWYEDIPATISHALQERLYQFIHVHLHQCIFGFDWVRVPIDVIIVMVLIHVIIGCVLIRARSFTKICAIFTIFVLNIIIFCLILVHTLISLILVHSFDGNWIRCIRLIFGRSVVVVIVGGVEGGSVVGCIIIVARVEGVVVVTVIVVIGGDDEIAVAVSEGKTKGRAAATSKRVNSVNYIGRHGERGPSVAIDSTIGGQAKEVISTLDVAGQTKGKGTGGPRHHGVVVLLVGLDVHAKFQLAVLCVVQL